MISLIVEYQLECELFSAYRLVSIGYVWLIIEIKFKIEGIFQLPKWGRGAMVRYNDFNEQIIARTVKAVQAVLQSPVRWSKISIDDSLRKEIYEFCRSVARATEKLTDGMR